MSAEAPEVDFTRIAPKHLRAHRQPPPLHCIEMRAARDEHDVVARTLCGSRGDDHEAFRREQRFVEGRLGKVDRFVRSVIQVSWRV